jgi:hypothetical protein
VVFALTILFGFATTGSANNPKQNVKSHSYVITKNENNKKKAAIVKTAKKPKKHKAPYLGVTQSDIVAWTKVSICEEGGNWTVQGSVYSGGLGMLNATWIAYGGLQFAPNAGQASIVQQIAIAKRVQPNPPDQAGCSGAW